MSLDAKLEKIPAQWERIVSEQDRSDINRFVNRYSEENWLTGNLQGLILRRGTECIGYILLSFQKYRDALHVQDIDIKEGERSPGVSYKLIPALREYAKELGAKNIAWNPSGDVMPGIADKLSRYAAQNEMVIPVDQLDISMLTGRL